MDEEKKLTKKELCEQLRDKCRKFGLPLIEIVGEDDDTKYCHPIFKLDDKLTISTQHDIERLEKDVMGFYCPYLKYADGKKGEINIASLPYEFDICEFVREFKYLKHKVYQNVDTILGLKSLQEELGRAINGVDFDFNKKPKADKQLACLQLMEAARKSILEIDYAKEDYPF